MVEDYILSQLHENIENLVDSEALHVKPLEQVALLTYYLTHCYKSYGSLSYYGAPCFAWVSNKIIRCCQGKAGEGWQCGVTDIPLGEILVIGTPLVCALDVPICNLQKKKVLDKHHTNGKKHNTAILLLECLLQRLHALYLSGATDTLKALITALLDIHPRNITSSSVEKVKKKIPQSLFKEGRRVLKHVLCMCCINLPWDTDTEICRVVYCFKLNSMGIAQNAEQLGFTQRYSKYKATALYPAPISLFNHSCSPNVVRCTFGDIIFLRASSNITAGENLCISYIEAEALTLPKSLRHDQLQAACGMKFCVCLKCLKEGSQGTTKNSSTVVEVFGKKLQRFVSFLTGWERLSALQEIKKAIKEETRTKSCMAANRVSTENCQIEPLFEHILRLETEIALCCVQLELWDKALTSFQTCWNLSCKYLGDKDEALICFGLHKARCLAILFLKTKDIQQATVYEKKGKDALFESFQVHQNIFGGANNLFMQRFKHEIIGNFISNLHQSSSTLLILTGLPALLNQWLYAATTSSKNRSKQFCNDNFKAIQSFLAIKHTVRKKQQSLALSKHKNTQFKLIYKAYKKAKCKSKFRKLFYLSSLIYTKNRFKCLPSST